MSDHNLSNLQHQQQPSSAGLQAQQNQQLGLTPPRDALNRSRFNNQPTSLLKQLGSPSAMSSEQLIGYTAAANSQQQTHNVMPQFQQQQPLVGQGGAIQMPGQQANHSKGSSGGAFDQNTYMQLLQRQQSLTQQGLTTSRPQSRGRIGVEQFYSGQQNQAAVNADSSILLSPNHGGQQMQANNVLNFGGHQHQASHSGLPTMQKINGQTNSFIQGGMPDMQQQQQQNNYMSNFSNQSMPMLNTSRSTSAPRGPQAYNNFIGQAQNNNQQLDVMQNTGQFGMYRNAQQQPQQPQPQPQAQSPPIPYDQLQFIMQLLQNQNQSQNQPQSFENQQLIQQLLMQNQSSNQQQHQVTQPINQPPQLSQRNAMPQPNLSLPQMYQSPNLPSQAQQTLSQTQQFTKMSNNTAGNPQLQQISENVNQYKRLIENYKQSTIAQSTANNTNLTSQMNTSASQNQIHQQHHSPLFQQQQPPPKVFQRQTTLTQDQLSAAQQMILNQTSNSCEERSNYVSNGDGNQGIALGASQGANGLGVMPPSYESFMVSQQLDLNGSQKTQETFAQIARQHHLNSERSGDQNDGISLVATRQFHQDNQNHQLQQINATQAAQESDQIQWQSHRQAPIAVQNHQQQHQALNSAEQNHYNNRSLPQFQSDQDENSAFLEGKSILGALNGNNTSMVNNGQQATIAFSSKQLSPIQKNKVNANEVENHQSSFLKNDDVDASQVVIGEHLKESRDMIQGTSDGGNGIEWIRTKNAMTESPIKENENRGDEEALKPKQLFQEGADLVTGSNDVDSQVIKKQQLTFEEMLESQLKKDIVEPQTSVAPQDVVKVEAQAVTTEAESHITPIKRDTQAAKKNFLRRGSSAKYDPQQARKNSQGSTTKFKYYTDNFSKRNPQVSAAPKGTSGIPSLSITKQNSQPKIEEKADQQRLSPKKTNVTRKLMSPKVIKHTESTLETKGGPTQRPASSLNQSSARLRPGPDRPQNSSRLKFNAPSKPKVEASNTNEPDKNKKAVDATKSGNTGRTSELGAKKPVEDSKKLPTASAQKAASSRLAQSKTLFKKQTTNNTKTEIKSVETKEPVQNSQQIPNEDLQVNTQSILAASEQPKDIIPISTEGLSNGGTPEVQLTSSNCDDREDSFCDKNSIAEFEMLEMECLKDDDTSSKPTAQQSGKPNGTKPRKQVNPIDLNKLNRKSESIGRKEIESSKIQIIHESPIRQNALQVLNNLKSATTDKQSNSSNETKLDLLEQQLMNLISEQEQEVTRLKEENQRVAVLQTECQKQLERLNKEAQDQDKAKKSNSNDIKKLKSQLKTKEEEIIRLQENLLGSQETNQKLKQANQSLSSRTMNNKSKKKEGTKASQTEKPLTRNIMTGTSQLVVKDQEIQVKINAFADDIDDFEMISKGEMTPEQQNLSHVNLEQDAGSVPVSDDNESPRPIIQMDLQVKLSQDKEVTDPSPQQNSQIVVVSQESCEVVETDAARGAEVLRSARGCSVGMPQAAQQSETPPQKTMKIVTFNLNESQDLKQHAAATTQSQVHDEDDQQDTYQSLINSEEDLEAEHIDEHPTEGEQVHSEDEVEEEDYDLVFPEKYHSDDAYKNLVQLDEVTSSEGKKQKFYECGKKEIIFPNTVKREVWPDGYQVVFFQNQDVKQTFPGGKIVYFFSDAKTTQTTFPDGLQVFKFQNNQIEKHFPDGTKEISFPDGTIKCLFSDGEEESIFPDGTIQKIEKTGLRIIEYAHGQRDYMYPDGTKVREYPNGTIKRYNLDGTVESIKQHESGPEEGDAELEHQIQN